MSKRKYVNRLNDLDNKSWLKFQKSWFIHNPPPRKSEVLRHPAKYPETLAQEFIEFFTKQGEFVFDPMVGTGSTLIAALRAGRHSAGIELNPVYAETAAELVVQEREELGLSKTDLDCIVIQGDARQMGDILDKSDLPPIDYVITSPPYWDMLHASGAETQRQRRQDDDLDVHYSDDSDDLGNIHNYKLFLDELVDVYAQLEPHLAEKAYLTIIVKNVKKGGRIYPLAWDLARELGKTYTLKDERIWCQDNQPLFPYGMGNAWVSNTFHHYCLQFRNDRDPAGENT